jgi:hypothetical protein
VGEQRFLHFPLLPRRAEERRAMAKDFAKGPTEIIRVERREFRGRQYIDARVYYLGPESPTDYLPSKKGLMLSPELTAEIAQEMLKLAAET